MLKRIRLIGTRLAVVRLIAFATLLVLKWTGRETIASLPLVLLLYPEGLLVPADVVWTLGEATVFAAILTAGSFVIAAMAVAAARAGVER